VTGICNTVTNLLGVGIFDCCVTISFPRTSLRERKWLVVLDICIVGNIARSPALIVYLQLHYLLIAICGLNLCP
jgi:hypothetical protein